MVDSRVAELSELGVKSSDITLGAETSNMEQTKVGFSLKFGLEFS